MIYNAVVGSVALLLATSGVMAKHVSFSPGTSWANRAWCQPHVNCGEADITGAEVVLVSFYYTNKEEIRALRRKGKVVMCYMSAGALMDKEKKSGMPIAKRMEGWPGITWLNILKYEKLKRWMTDRLTKAKKMGCQAIEADNIDCWQNDCVYGKNAYDPKLKKAEISYVKWLTSEAHKLGLAIGQKNSLELVEDLVDQMDYLINENCSEYDECNLVKPYIKANKAVFGSTTFGRSRDVDKEIRAICKMAFKSKISMKFAVGDRPWSDC